MKKPFKILLLVLLVLVLVVLGYVIYVFASYDRIEDNLTLKVNRPEQTAAQDVQTPQASQPQTAQIPIGETLSLTSWNIGFGAYTDDYSFFMDGGKYSRAFSESAVVENLTAIGQELADFDTDFSLIQEVDIAATRSYQVDERAMLVRSLDVDHTKYWTFAINYDSPYLFYPILEPHGASKAGLQTFSNYAITSALRRSLPIQTDIAKVLDLDRCYCVNRLPAANGKELILINLHLSAYTTDPTIADQQLAMLYDDMVKEYEAGNYVICGGDFNKDLLGNSPEIFGVSGEAYSWAQPLPTEDIPDGFRLIAPLDPNNPVPSCRNADAPWDPQTNFQVTLDGFLVSDNVTVLTNRVVDTQFAYSDHNPVQMEFCLS